MKKLDKSIFFVITEYDIGNNRDCAAASQCPLGLYTTDTANYNYITCVPCNTSGTSS